MRPRSMRGEMACGLALLLTGALGLSACCQYPGRCAARSPAAKPIGSHVHPARQYPGANLGRLPSEPTWMELPVLAVNVRREPDARRLIVKTQTPTDGWKVRVKALSRDAEEEAEFQIVGLAPIAAEGLDGEARTIYREIPLAPSVRHIEVRGSEGSMLMDIE